jgi:hypothetical protein
MGMDIIERTARRIVDLVAADPNLAAEFRDALKAKPGPVARACFNTGCLHQLVGWCQTAASAQDIANCERRKLQPTPGPVTTYTRNCAGCGAVIERCMEPLKDVYCVNCKPPAPSVEARLREAGAGLTSNWHAEPGTNRIQLNVIVDDPDRAVAALEASRGEIPEKYPGFCNRCHFPGDGNKSVLAAASTRIHDLEGEVERLNALRNGLTQSCDRYEAELAKQSRDLSNLCVALEGLSTEAASSAKKLLARNGGAQ